MNFTIEFWRLNIYILKLETPKEPKANIRSEQRKLETNKNWTFSTFKHCHLVIRYISTFSMPKKHFKEIKFYALIFFGILSVDIAQQNLNILHGI